MSVTEEYTTPAKNHVEEDNISWEDMLLKCVYFDQDCFYDVRMLAADRRQRDWSAAYLPELATVANDAYVHTLEGCERDPFFERGNLGKFSEFDHEIMSQIHVETVKVLGSSQDGLYLEKGFSVFEKSPPALNETDLDVVFEYGGVEILQNCAPSTDAVHLCLTKTRTPGYFKLKICSPSMEKKKTMYFKNTHLKVKLFGDLDCSHFYIVRNSMNEVKNSVSILGNTEDELGIHEIDNVAAFKMKEWPEVASDFISRQRQSGWPDANLINAVTTNGCGFVPKGIPNSREKEYHWRISFAVSEKILIRSLTRAQIRAYLFFKSMYKLKLSKPEGLSSYMMKNVLFWTLETIDQSSWREDNILYCVEALVEMLCAFLEKGLIASYFLPHLNLIKNLDKDTLIVLGNKARAIQKDTFTSIVQCTESPKYKGGCEMNLKMIMSAYSSQDEGTYFNFISMSYLTMYMYLRLQVLRYQIRLVGDTLKESYETNCRSMVSVVAPRAAEYLLESIKLQPDNSLYSLKASGDGKFELNIEGMRTKVVEFWRSSVYKGLFKRTINDQEDIQKTTVTVVPEFSEFIDWVDRTCQWGGGVPINKDHIFFPPNLDMIFEL